MSKIIELKIKPEYFVAVMQGNKTAELRLNDILTNCGFGLQDGYAMLSFKLLKGGRQKDVKKNR